MMRTAAVASANDHKSNWLNFRLDGSTLTRAMQYNAWLARPFPYHCDKYIHASLLVLVLADERNPSEAVLDLVHPQAC
jgi:hypothetical protein